MKGNDNQKLIQSIVTMNNQGILGPYIGLEQEEPGPDPNYSKQS